MDNTFIPEPTLEQKEQKRREPQNLLRKHALFRRLRADIETFCEMRSPIFNDDQELQSLVETLSQRMEEIEKQLNKE